MHRRIVSLAVFVVIYYLVRFSITQGYLGKFFISFLDVGQGDSFIINFPNSGTFAVDAGSDYQSTYLIAKRFPYPVCRLKYIFITHYDNDHSGGLPRLSRYCGDAKIIDIMENNETVSVKNGIIMSLNPYNSTSGVSGEAISRNDRSLILLVRYRSFSALLTGDAGLKPLSYVSNTIKNSSLATLTPITIYKVPHHGSINNNDQVLVSELSPSYCVVSVGRNTYGHPSKLVLESLSDMGCLVLRTDEIGDITFVVD